MALEVQAKLLRVLQEHEFERLGSTSTVRADVRIVAATNQDLAKMVREKRFRCDLYYRLNVFPIALAPLRQRGADIPLLVEQFVEDFAGRMNKRIDKIPRAGMDALMRYSWPGNIRELQNVIERAVVLTQKDVLRLPPLPRDPAARTEPVTLQDAEREHILKALQAANSVVGGRNGAAVRLGLPRTTLMARMKKLGIMADRGAQAGEEHGQPSWQHRDVPERDYIALASAG